MSITDVIAIDNRLGAVYKSTPPFPSTFQLPLLLCSTLCKENTIGPANCALKVIGSPSHLSKTPLLSGDTLLYVNVLVVYPSVCARFPKRPSTGHGTSSMRGFSENGPRQFIDDKIFFPKALCNVFESPPSVVFEKFLQALFYHYFLLPLQWFIK